MTKYFDNFLKGLEKSKEKANKMLLYSTQKLCDMMISMERLADATSSDLANFASALKIAADVKSWEENLWDLYCMMTRGQWGLWRKNFLNFYWEPINLPS